MRPTDEMRAEALDRARNGMSMANYDAIIDGFIEKGIDEDNILPRENVFTYNAWRAQGRVVRRGEHGVKISTFVEMSSEDDSGERRSFRRPRMTTVFHVSQTDPL